MKRLFIIIILFLTLGLYSPAYAARIFPCAAGTQGETTGTLDNLASGSPDNLADGDMAAVFILTGTTPEISWYVYDADSVVAEDDPNTVRPKDFSDPSEPGVWLLANGLAKSLTIPKVSGSAGRFCHRSARYAPGGLHISRDYGPGSYNCRYARHHFQIRGLEMMRPKIQ